MARGSTGSSVSTPSCARSDRSGAVHAVHEDVELGQAARVGDGLAFGAAHQHRVGAMCCRKASAPGVFGMRVVADTQRRAAARRIEQLGDRVPGLRKPMTQRASSRRASGGHSDSVAMNTGSRARPGMRTVAAVVRDRQAEVVEDLGRVTRPGRARPVHQHRHAFLREQQREQGVRLGSLRAPLYEGSTTMGCEGSADRSVPAPHRGKPASSSVDSPLMRIAIANAPISRVGDAAVEHLAHQVVGLRLVNERAPSLPRPISLM
jgi:hypothetical protein